MSILGAVLAFGLIVGLAQSTAATATIAGALVFGSLWFWGLLALVTILLFTFIDNDEGFGATATLFGFLLIMQLFGDLKIFSYVRLQPLNAIKWTLCYFAAGTLWSIAKWWFYVRNERLHYDEEKIRFLQKNEVDGTIIPDKLKSSWTRHAPAKPSASRSKDKIIRWMTFWPWSAVWTLINDPIKKLFKSIYANIQNLLQKIADSAFAGTEADLE